MVSSKDNEGVTRITLTTANWVTLICLGVTQCGFIVVSQVSQSISNASGFATIKAELAELKDRVTKMEGHADRLARAEEGVVEVKRRVGRLEDVLAFRPKQ